ncbi:MAG: KpsF/GutQ family sugar-phosphate isomerase [Sphingobacteriaceae bacterium]
MLSIARKVFAIEIESLQQVAALLDSRFDEVISHILMSSGKVVISGMGKSGLIGKKIAATLTSTGTPSFFLHPGEGFHGDLGMVNPSDIVILISYSGETDEILKIVPFLKWNGNTMIAITGNSNSTLANNSTFILNINIAEEACPFQLAPTSSTTAALVMGDALAVALMDARQFQPEDFARFHPGGRLGRKLLTRLKDVMRKDGLPYISLDASFEQLVLGMSEGRLGMVIVGTAKNPQGIITDGDLRRGLVKYPDIKNITILDLLKSDPLIIDENEHLHAAEQLMLERKITTILVGKEKNITGVYQIFSL